MSGAGIVASLGSALGSLSGRPSGLRRLTAFGDEPVTMGELTTGKVGLMECFAAPVRLDDCIHIPRITDFYVGHPDTPKCGFCGGRPGYDGMGSCRGCGAPRP